MSHGKLSWEQWSSHQDSSSTTKKMTALSPISMQVSVERCSTIDRSSSLQKPKTFKSLRPLAKSRSYSTTTQTTNASIPSRYQTFFFAATERKGFNSQAARFSSDIDINENPGPGKYEANNNTFETQSSSFSKKGTGGFASKTYRFRAARKQLLGPGSYYPRPVENRIDFNKTGASRNFKLPIAVKQADNNGLNTSPAPNTYDLSGVHNGKTSTVTAEAAVFKSKTKREIVPSTAADNPAPCQYTVQDSALHPSSCAHKSVFNSKSNRDGLGKITKGPGPADYTPVLNEVGDTSKSGPPKPLPYYRQKHYLCISAPAMPLPPLPPLPGPGHYETQTPILEPHEKKLVSGSMFKSTTSRWIPLGLDRMDQPGPGAYNPMTVDKQSYLYNIRKKWI